MSAWLIFVACLIVGCLGALHAYLTFFSRAFEARDPALAKAMTEVSPRISSATTIWRAGQGFHASHSLGALLFAVVYGQLCLQAPALLFSSWGLLLGGGVYLMGMTLLAFRYWFHVPQRGVVIATVCYLAGCLLA